MNLVTDVADMLYVNIDKNPKTTKARRRPSAPTELRYSEGLYRNCSPEELTAQASAEKLQGIKLAIATIMTMNKNPKEPSIPTS